RISEARRPVTVRAPGRTLENEAEAALGGNRQIPRVVPLERHPAVRPAQQVKRREVRQLEPVVENQRSLDAAVGQKQPVPLMRQPASRRRDAKCVQHGYSSIGSNAGTWFTIGVMVRR